MNLCCANLIYRVFLSGEDLSCSHLLPAKEKKKEKEEENEIQGARKDLSSSPTLQRVLFHSQHVDRHLVYVFFSSYSKFLPTCSFLIYLLVLLSSLLSPLPPPPFPFSPFIVHVFHQFTCRRLTDPSFVYFMLNFEIWMQSGMFLLRSVCLTSTLNCSSWAWITRARRRCFIC